MVHPELTDGASAAFLTGGLWNLRHIVREVTGLIPVRWQPPLRKPRFSYVVGWGFKPTSSPARLLSKSAGTAYIALEDGFLRSVHPGPASRPLSIVVDQRGIYYRADGPSDLEVLIQGSASNFDRERRVRALNAIEMIRQNALSKYNFAPLRDEAELGLDPARRKGRVLVIDQTRGDASVDNGLASADTFNEMFEAAKHENPGCEIVVKTHPEVSLGLKSGYLNTLEKRGDVRVVDQHANPWSLIEAADTVYVVTSQFGFEALLAGRKVVCFGAPFYSGWGLTEDRVHISRRTARPSLEQLFAAVYFDYARYVCPRTGLLIEFEEAARALLDDRRREIGY